MGFITNIAVLATALVPSLVLASPPSLPTINKISFSGNGCTQGSNPKWSGNLDELTVKYSEFTARYPGEATSNCQIHITTTGGTAGWQYAIASTELKGSASLEAGATLTAFTSVYFSADASNTVSTTSARRSSWQRDCSVD